MDLHPVENQPFPPDAAPMVNEGTRPGGQSRNPLIDTPPLPSAMPQFNPRQGRGFFFIEKLHSGQWRCVVKSAKGRVTAWRDFGYTAEDYLRAWEWGNEWVGS